MIARSTAVAALPLLSILSLLACAPSQRPDAMPAKDTETSGTAESVTPPPAPAPAPADAAAPEATSAPPEADAGGPTDAGAAPKATVDPKVKIVTIGMHVAGGPYDEKTKEPFKKAVEPHFPEIAQCWGKHVPRPPKQADVGVDLLIEASGGRPKVSNPRSTLGKDPEVEAFVPCVVAVFEGVEFPKLARGRTGVSYSLRFTTK